MGLHMTLQYFLKFFQLKITIPLKRSQEKMHYFICFAEYILRYGGVTLLTLYDFRDFFHFYLLRIYCRYCNKEHKSHNVRGTIVVLRMTHKCQK